MSSYHEYEYGYGSGGGNVVSSSYYEYELENGYTGEDNAVSSSYHEYEYGYGSGGDSAMSSSYYEYELDNGYSGGDGTSMSSEYSDEYRCAVFVNEVKVAEGEMFEGAFVSDTENDGNYPNHAGLGHQGRGEPGKCCLSKQNPSVL